MVRERYLPPLNSGSWFDSSNERSVDAVSVGARFRSRCWCLGALSCAVSESVWHEVNVHGVAQTIFELVRTHTLTPTPPVGHLWHRNSMHCPDKLCNKDAVLQCILDNKPCRKARENCSPRVLVCPTPRPWVQWCGARGT